MKVGDLVQLRAHYEDRDRWAIISEDWGYSSFCKVMFVDTNETIEIVKAALIVYSDKDEE